MFEHGSKHWSTLKKLIWLKGAGIIGGASGIWKTVSGSLIHITDALASPMQKCEVTLEPIQDLHGQDAPYPAGGGKNIDPYDNLNSSARLWGSDNSYQEAVFRSLPVGTYTMSCKFKVLTNPDSEANVQYGVLVRYPDGGGGYVVIIPYQLTTAPATVGAVYEWHKSFTLTESLAEQSTLKVYFYCASGGQSTATANAYDIQIEKGDIANPTFAPYSNICPITGWTGASVTRTGENLLPDETTYKNGSTYFIGASSGNVYPFFLKAGTYTASNAGPAAYMYWQLKGTSINNIIHNASTTVGTFTLPQDGWYRFWFYTAAADASFTNIQIELGSTATDYELYSGTTLSVTFPDGQTVYGGEYEVVSGKVKPYKEYDSYNGETLTGRWMSSIDKYVAGTTPTIGAQVVDLESFDTTIQVTPQPINTLVGENNVWADAGDVEITYKAKAS